MEPRVRPAAAPRTGSTRLASASVTVAAHDWSPPANVTTSYTAPSMAPAFPNEAANAVDQYEAVAEAVNGGTPQNSALAYDVRGNLTSDTVSSYTYDLENRMLTATAAGTSCASACSYTYDPMGRRVSKTVGATVTKFLRAGAAEIAEYDGSGNLLRRYVPNVGPDSFIVWIEGTGVTSASMKWILADRQGSVAVVTDNAGKATQRFAYDPFGNETQGAPTTGFPFRYTGQRFDPETGLYYYKARLYSAKLGRFLQTDPVGYEDQFNLYTYVDNDPINHWDPTGEGSITVRYRDQAIRSCKGCAKIPNAISGGHSGIVTIDDKTGRTRYTEYGRYGPNGEGQTRNIPMPDLEIGRDGLPTVESIEELLNALLKEAERKGSDDIVIDVQPGGDVNKMNEESEKSDDHPYRVPGNTCHDHCRRVKNAGGSDEPTKRYKLTRENASDVAEDIRKQYEEAQKRQRQ